VINAISLATTDQAGAKSFYPGLFGWTVNDVPTGPDGVYTIFQLRGRNVGAAYGLMEDQKKNGVPPHWLTYIAVTNADEIAAKAGSLGGVDFGGMMPMTPHMEKVPPHWMNYLTVQNCDQTVAKANQLGGKTLMPPMDVPNVGRFATHTDPQGAAFAVITLAPKHKG
jgi:predicted enzyme related to lactoylglutathione lyase